ncbi:MAG: rhomboid family intramembrane serine protease [Verrucomicrobia bacterium]|nr:rhomboid family intramembrane serine protease [Verrucomicrobiota bacterium]
MQTMTALIPARSKRQAMDWSLVLTSQEIECVILPPSEEHPWALLIEPKDHERALAAIHQYRLENRGWGWRAQLAETELTFQWSVVVWCFLMAIFYVLSMQPASGLAALGRMDSVTVAAGQWWRLFTAVLLHADVGHLMANLSAGFLVLGLAMGRYGIGCALLAAYLAGAGGNLTGLALYPEPYRGVGASGMVMGGLGLLAVQSLSLWRESPKAARYILSGVVAGVLLFVLLGLDPASDVVAHLGGFVFGLALGGVLALVRHEIVRRAAINLVCGATLGGLIIWTWWLALR